MVIKTFYVKHIDVKEVLKRVHALGIMDYTVTWGYDMDEKLNALTFQITSTVGSGSKEKETEVIKAIESFIKSIDIEKKPE